MAGPRVPDFYIIGAPKCGTTALYTYLRDHPLIFLPSLKEPQYFCFDFPGICQVRGYDHYLGLFYTARPEQVVGEASVWYLYSKVAIHEIVRCNQNAKFIAMLRSPIDMCYSLHGHHVVHYQEDIYDFEDAWNAQDQRRQGSLLPTYCPAPEHLQYREIASYSTQLTRIFELVPETQVQVIVAEDFFADTRAAYKDILAFLDVPDDGRTFFPPVNERAALRSRTVAALVHGIPGGSNAIYGPLRRMAIWLGVHPKMILMRMNTVKEPRQAMPQSLRDKLKLEFEGDIRRMEEMLGRSLDFWR